MARYEAHRRRPAAKVCYYADAEGNRIFRALRPVGQMANATGAGDAFMAGFTYGLVNHLPLEGTARFCWLASRRFRV
ncbi:MAG: PfkB family carbohydrate kinase [Eubacteriales bacterium]